MAPGSLQDQRESRRIRTIRECISKVLSGEQQLLDAACWVVVGLGQGWEVLLDTRKRMGLLNRGERGREETTEWGGELGDGKESMTWMLGTFKGVLQPLASSMRLWGPIKRQIWSLYGVHIKGGATGVNANDANH